jgi:hypothetical protein
MQTAIILITGHCGLVDSSESGAVGIGEVLKTPLL